MLASDLRGIEGGGVISTDSFAARLGPHMAGYFLYVEMIYNFGGVPHGSNRDVSLYLREVWRAA